MTQTVNASAQGLYDMASSPDCNVRDVTEWLEAHDRAVRVAAIREAANRFADHAETIDGFVTAGHAAAAAHFLLMTLARDVEAGDPERPPGPVSA